MPVQLCRPRECESFRVLYDIEAYLRLLVRWELRGTAGRSWKGLIDPKATSDAEARQQQEREGGLIDPLESGLLSYLHLSELKEIVIGPLWLKCLASDWSAQDVVRSEFKKLIAVRNKVAHFRPITDWDAKVVERFSEDLTRWTRPYRRLREIELRWALKKPLEGDFAGKAKKLGMDEALAGVSALVTPSTGDEIVVAFVGHHVALRIRKVGGAYDPELACNLFAVCDSEVTLARVGAFGAYLEVLVPAQMGSAAVVKVLERLVELCRRPAIDALPSENLIGAYGLDVREGILSDSTTFPDVFTS